MQQEKPETAAERIYNRFHIRFLPGREGIAESELVLRPEDANFAGAPYGGVMFNMADVTAGAALRSIGVMGPTLSGEVRFMRAVKDAKKLLCRAEVRKAGRTICFIDAAVRDEQGRELAAMSFVFTRTEAGHGSL